MKVQGRLIQARFIEIHQVFVKEWDTFRVVCEYVYTYHVKKGSTEELMKLSKSIADPVHSETFPTELKLDVMTTCED